MSKYPDWTEEEIEILKENYPCSTKQEMEKLLPNRKMNNIITKAYRLGVKKEPRWTDKEIEELKRLVLEGYSIDEICDFFDGKYTHKAVQVRACQVGVNFRPKWTKEEEDILIENYPYKPIDEFMHLLNNRTRNAIISHAAKLNLKSYLFWTNDEEKFLINNWQTMSDYEISLNLNKSQLCVKTKRKYLGLFRVNKDNLNYESLSKYIRSNNSKWREESLNKCNYRCVITGSKNIEIHHLVNVSTMVRQVLLNLNLEYKRFEEYKEEELKLILDEFLKIQSNYPLGVCLRKDLHMLFHSLFGQQNNSEEQFKHFVKEYKKGTYNNY